MDTINRGFIVKFNGYLNVPEEFDITQTIQRFKSKNRIYLHNINGGVHMAKIYVDNTEITILEIEEKDYISLTDMVRNIDNGLEIRIP